jgi:hypothetical protein
MEEITYQEAAELLERPYVSIRQAASRGDLTKCAGTTMPVRVLKEQVLLFKNRNITPKSLPAHERKLWEEYRRIALGETDESKKYDSDVIEQAQLHAQSLDIDASVDLLEEAIQRTEDILKGIRPNILRGVLRELKEKRNLKITAAAC